MEYFSSSRNKIHFNDKLNLSWNCGITDLSNLPWMFRNFSKLCRVFITKFSFLTDQKSFQNYQNRIFSEICLGQLDYKSRFFSRTLKRVPLSSTHQFHTKRQLLFSLQNPLVPNQKPFSSTPKSPQYNTPLSSTHSSVPH